MSRRNKHSQFRAGDRISERAARRAFAHFRTAAVKDAPLAAPPDPANGAGGGRGDTPGSAADSQILRRWVVADLIVAGTRRRAFA